MIWLRPLLQLLSVGHTPHAGRHALYVVWHAPAIQSSTRDVTIYCPQALKDRRYDVWGDTEEVCLCGARRSLFDAFEAA